MHTKDFEFLLEKKNVIGVSWEPSDDDHGDGVLHVNVSKKMAEADLDPDDIIADAVAAEGYDVDTEVHDEGLGEDAPGFDPLDLDPDAEPDVTEDPRKDRYRPVETGCSEINWRSSAATGGHYPVRVEDTNAPSARWWDEIAKGDFVRLSNNHVYALTNDGELGESILQPSPYDGGDTVDEDIVGKLAGYVPIENHVTVDCAVRSAGKFEEVGEPIGLDSKYGRSIKREITSEFEGRQVVKSGRTTEVERGIVKQTNASLLVNYGDPHGQITLRDQIVTTAISRGGDSGSPVYVDTGDNAGALMGLLFAGSSSSTIVNKIANVENELGVRMLPTDYEEGGGDEPDMATAHVSFELTESGGGDTPQETGRIEVTVARGDTGDPVSGAQVIAESLKDKHIRKTDVDGLAVIKETPISDYSIEVSAKIDGEIWGPMTKEITADDFDSA